MKSTLLFACAVCALLTAVKSGEQDVVVLDDSNFDFRTKEMDTVLIMFYAPWCGHCKRIKPEYEKAAEILKADDPAIPLAKVDCTEAGKGTCSRFGVSGYPTLKIFRNGEFSQEYNGPREHMGIVKYMRGQVGPAAKPIESIEALTKYLDNDDGSVIGYFDSDSSLKSSFEKTADKLRETFRFALVTKEDVIKAKGVASGSIVLHRPTRLVNKFEPADVVYSGEADKSKIESWINEEYHGLVGHRTQDNSKQFPKPLIVAYYSVDYVKNPKGTNYWRNRVLSVAKDFESLNFGVAATDDFQHELNEFGIEFAKGDKPIIAGWNEKSQKFVMSGEFSVEKLREWTHKLVDGVLDPYMKSEPIPEGNSKAVKVAVGKNFQEVVIDNGVDTLIEFYAPWCGHCKKLTPIYEELAEKMKDEKVAIVKMDATANDVPPPFDVRGFPTIYWAPKNAKDKPVKYQGGRELSDFIEYIAQHSTDGLSKSKDEL
ncbi:unnamed protein product [Notodromas monacha]|uniref:Protein disulfide-isomerase n=1 Tax=Notodromas monacha TaxID=399045 RepID=A0A7R9GL34_9CRUS|nr:unnamed protein product [Notodromas monacha]CAG0924510.1 unnamed protein product [Notodromas monacha]